MSAPLTKEEAFIRLGNITREMHAALSILGGNQLHDIVSEIPDARDRLKHVGKMTEDAANKVLTLVEGAKPDCDELAARGLEISQSLKHMASSSDLNPDLAKGLLTVCGKFAQRSAVLASNQSSVLSEIMMAQDFQDLSGQVITKVINVINRTELQLVHLLLDSAPDRPTQARDETSEAVTVDNHKLEGPQTTDKALQQDDVDDLLASLGF